MIRARLTAAAGLLPLLLLAALPLGVGNEYYLHQATLILIYAILLFGLDIVVGYSGEISLAHAALFGVGAYTAAILNGLHGWPFWATLPLSLLVTFGFGLVLALPALRVTGPYLAMVTLAFGTIAQILINEMDFLTNGPLGITIHRPHWFGRLLPPPGFYELVLLVFILTAVLMHRLLSSHWGRAFEAMRGSAVACDCMGVSVYRYKVLAFGFSAGLAGLAGGLFTFNELYVAPNTFNFELTILFLLALIMGGRKSLLGPIVGATIVVLLPNLLDDITLFRRLCWVLASLALCALAQALWFPRPKRGRLLAPVLGALGLLGAAYRLNDMTDWRITLFGSLILFVIYYLQDGIVGWAQTVGTGLLRQLGWLSGTSAAAPQGTLPWTEDLAPRVLLTVGDEGDEGEDLPVPQSRSGKARGTTGTFSTGSAPLLEAQGIVMQFGGLRALDGFDLKLVPNTIHGLIGPNGSGKSTFINVLSGIYRPTQGSLKLADQPLGGLSPARIALRGLARTFQNLQLFGEMTVLENVLVGLTQRYRSNLGEVLLRLPRWQREERLVRARAHQLLEQVGLSAWAQEPARNLSYGRQRLLEIGRALALDPALLLLDEPAAGMSAAEIADLKTMILRLRGRGMTVLLIEHHMDLVMGVCDRITVLDQGRKLAEGTPQQVREDERVVAAYLGAAHNL